MATLVGKVMLAAGAALLVLGAVLVAVGHLGGRVPGDLYWHRNGVSVFVPLGTCVLLSIVLTLLANMVARWFGR